MTYAEENKPVTVEELAIDCLDVRELQRAGFRRYVPRWPEFRWSGVERIRWVARRGRATELRLALESLLDGQAKALTQKAIDLALSGDLMALRICLDRNSPRSKIDSLYTECKSMSWIPRAFRRGAAREIADNPMDQRVETRLKNLRRAARCGARTRAGAPCQRPAIRGRSRCRLHGGLSPGAPRGSRNGNYKTGDWTADTVEERRWLRSLVQSFAKNGGAG
jgi:hypothetical protein